MEARGHARRARSAGARAFAITGDPYLQLGLANTRSGQPRALFLPVELAIQPTCRWLVALDTGSNGELAVFDEAVTSRSRSTVRARATPQVDVGATLGFASLLGPQNTPKQRVLFVTVGWRSGR